jgi:hypothetical protein
VSDQLSVFPTIQFNFALQSHEKRGFCCLIELKFSVH